MKTDLGSTIVFAIIIVICILPFIFLYIGKNKRKNKLRNTLASMARERNRKLHKYEIFTNFAIGTDENREFLFFIKQRQDRIKEYQIALKEVKDCKIRQTDRTLRQNKKQNLVIEKLELRLIPYSNKQDEINLEFFNTDDNLPLYGELGAIKSWQEFVRDCLPKNKKAA
ncbi:hypothetical protein [Pseudozobellia thermophila]|uniref:Uncharacterized protein n=1 Tax=Pseudozobellia thermophila TaxID=192903 RepID=A0A1M6LAG1_9FLAO|nr:hypothetical protein [Pseudozobellia thermophila]SHJ68119.1 hypothetical protein SAMN04488513_10784 [Pseudozobellia thermophila]